MRDRIFKEYLGDGAYVDYDGYQIWVTTSNGISTTNEIAFEPEVMKRLIAYWSKILEIRSKKMTGEERERKEKIYKEEILPKYDNNPDNVPPHLEPDYNEGWQS